MRGALFIDRNFGNLIARIDVNRGRFLVRGTCVRRVSDAADAPISAPLTSEDSNARAPLLRSAMARREPHSAFGNRRRAASVIAAATRTSQSSGGSPLSSMPRKTA